MNELLSVNNNTLMNSSIALIKQNQPLNLSITCPIADFVQETLKGICHPIANHFYQIIRPQNLLDLYYGVKIVDKRVPAYQDYKDALTHLELLWKNNAKGASLSAVCSNFFKLETIGTAGGGLKIPSKNGSKILLIRCLNPKTIRKFTLAFNRALNFFSKVSLGELKNIDDIEKEFKYIFSALEFGNEYRQKGVIVSQIDLSKPKQLDAYMFKMGFTPEMIQRSFELGAKAYEESQRLYGNDSHPQFSDEYKLLMQDIMYFPPQFKQIPLLIKDFLKNLVNRLEEIFRYGVTDQNKLVVLAAWAHQELIKLHPLEDGNGRLARIFMNAILKFFDIDPIVFLDDDEYVDAIKKDIKTPGVFANYLIEVAIPEMQNNPGLKSWDKQESILKRVRDALIASRANQ